MRANYLRMYRKRTGLSQHDIATLLDCHHSAKFSRYEHLIQTPALSTVFGYELILGVPACELFAGLHEEVKQKLLLQIVLFLQYLNEQPSTSKIQAKRTHLEHILAYHHSQS